VLVILTGNLSVIHNDTLIMAVWADTRMLWRKAEFGVFVHSRYATVTKPRGILKYKINNLCYIMYARFKLEYVDLNYASYISTKICKSLVVSEMRNCWQRTSWL